MTVMRGGKPHWPVTAHVTDDLRMAFVHSDKHPAKPHPDRPQPGQSKAHTTRAIAGLKRRRAARAAAIAAGDIT